MILNLCERTEKNWSFILLHVAPFRTGHDIDCARYFGYLWLETFKRGLFTQKWKSSFIQPRHSKPDIFSVENDQNVSVFHCLSVGCNDVLNLIDFYSMDKNCWNVLWFGTITLIFGWTISFYLISETNGNLCLCSSPWMHWLFLQGSNSTKLHWTWLLTGNYKRTQNVLNERMWTKYLTGSL